MLKIYEYPSTVLPGITSYQVEDGHGAIFGIVEPHPTETDAWVLLAPELAPEWEEWLNDDGDEWPASAQIKAMLNQAGYSVVLGWMVDGVWQQIESV